MSEEQAIEDLTDGVGPQLRSGIEDLTYVVDVDPNGAESVVVYVTVSVDAELSASEKREVEQALRSAIAAASDYQVYFRWRTVAEDAAERKVTTKSGLLDEPRSALR